MLKRIGAEESGEFKAIASGTLPSGKPVIVNADGTVSVIEETSTSIASSTEFANNNLQYTQPVYDSANNKVVVAYQNVDASPTEGTVCVGTVSGTSISWGTPVNVGIYWDTVNVVYDSVNEKIFLFMYDTNGYNGKAIVGTVSGNSISFGSAVTVTTGAIYDHHASFDSANGKILLTWRDGNIYGRARVATISGTSVSFGTELVYRSSYTTMFTNQYDSVNGKFICTYSDNSNPTVTYGVVATISGTSVSFGSSTTIASSITLRNQGAFDPINGVSVCSYIVYTSPNSAYMIALKIDGSTVTAGTPVQFNDTYDDPATVSYNASAKKTLFAYRERRDNSYTYIQEASASGTDLTLSGAQPIQTTGSTPHFGLTYDPDTEQNIITYDDPSNSGHGYSRTISVGSTTLTSENYIGMSRGSVSTFDKSYGSVATYSTNNTNFSSIAYDSNSNKIVIAYADDTDTTGKAVIGTVDSANNTISFGTPVTFNSGTTQWVSVVFDSNSNKVVISYRDAANNYYGTSIVGTVSGTSISFGTEVVFKSTYTEDTNMTFDTTANKVVLSYKVGGSNTGNAIVGTVSGTSISFGSEATFESGDPDTGADIVYDANADKTVIVYRDIGDSSKGKAVVGTVSGTSISFGTPVVYNTSGTSYSKVVYNSVDNNVVVAYRTASSGARARVGTVSGTTISFGDEATVASTSGVFYIGLGYNPQTNRLALAYGDTGNSNQGTIFEGTISGNTLSFDSGTIFNTNRTQWSAMAYDSTADRIVLNFEAHGDSGKGKAMVIETGGVARGSVANSGNASVDIIGSVSDNQLSLTAGQQYFVQTDGTISTTAGSPSVLAGTAISATELVVKT